MYIPSKFHYPTQGKPLSLSLSHLPPTLRLWTQIVPLTLTLSRSLSFYFTFYSPI